VAQAFLPAFIRGGTDTPVCARRKWVEAEWASWTMAVAGREGFTRTQARVSVLLV